MYVTEQDLTILAQTLREEFSAAITGLREDLSVRIIEAHNRTAGVSLPDVRALLDEMGFPGKHLTEQDVRDLIPAPVPFDHGEFKGPLLALQTFANGLADRIGAPRMGG